MPGKHLSSLLVKPAGADCNLDCEYCFFLDRDATVPAPRMAADVLEAMTRQALAGAGPEMSFCWQGGEPTLMGLDFYREAVALQRRHAAGRRIENSLQTNGLLIDDEWAAFLREEDFLVGLSIDGPEAVHDRYRRSRNGAGSWSLVREKAKLLLDAGVKTNALVVVNDHSARFPAEIYGFLKETGLSWMQFIPCVEPDPADPARPASYSVSGEAWGRFQCELFDLWWEDLDGLTPAAEVRGFDAALRHHLGMPSSLCTHRETCGDYLVVMHDGGVYPCDFFVSPARRLGNVLEDDLRDLLNSPAQTAFGRAKADLPPGCLACEWRPRCHGGCPKDRRVDPVRRLSHLCEGERTFFAHADTRLAELAAQMEQR
ncbi:MAG: anaerobic sulfatase maturase [Planctomycetota bacterium]